MKSELFHLAYCSPGRRNMYLRELAKKCLNEDATVKELPVKKVGMSITAWIWTGCTGRVFLEELHTNGGVTNTAVVTDGIIQNHASNLLVKKVGPTAITKHNHDLDEFCKEAWQLQR